MSNMHLSHPLSSMGSAITFSPSTASFETSQSATASPERIHVKYLTRRIIMHGWLLKWTNYLRTWRSRYFILEPPTIRYSLQEQGPIKQSFPLAKCIIRTYIDDPLRFDIEVSPQMILFLKADTTGCRNRWYSELRHWQRSLFQAQLEYHLHSTIPAPINRLAVNDNTSHTSNFEHPLLVVKAEASKQSLLSGQYRTDRLYSNLQAVSAENKNSLESQTKTEVDDNSNHQNVISASDSPKVSNSPSSESSPVLRLIEGIMDCRQNLDCIMEYIQNLENKIFSELKQLSQDTVSDSLKLHIRQYFHQTHSLQELIEKQLSSQEFIISEEHFQRKKLESSLKLLAEKTGKLMDDGSISSMGADSNTFASKSRSASDVELSEFYECSDIAPGSNVGSSPEAKETTLKQAAPVSEQPFTFMTKLPEKPKNIARRKILPTPRADLKISLWSILKDAIGKDLSRISMPISFNEPTSLVQRISEDFLHIEYIQKAASCKGSTEKMSYVIPFIISPFASAQDRTYKPFNPLLGETYEISHRGFQFISEQVGHHPPVTAYHVHGDGFVSWSDISVKTKILGKAIEVSMPGLVHLCFPNSQDKDHITYNRPKMRINNVVWGKIWIELEGIILVLNHSTGDYAVIEFQRRGWFEKDIHRCRSLIYDSHGVAKYLISGIWSDELYLEEVESQPGPPYKVSPIDKFNISLCDGGAANDFPEKDARRLLHLESDRLMQLLEIDWDVKVVPNSRKLIWQAMPRPPNSSMYYGFGFLTMELNENTEDYDRTKGASMPCTDSRYRPDKRCLENGDINLAISEKERLEQKQRAAAKLRPRGELDYSPKWFFKCTDCITQKPAWIFKNTYWNTKENNSFDNLPDIY